MWDLTSRREAAANATAHSRAGVLHTAALVHAQSFISQGRDGLVKLWDVETFGAAAEPLATFYSGSYSFTKAATLRWPSHEARKLILCPSSVDNKVVDGLLLCFISHAAGTARQRLDCN